MILFHYNSFDSFIKTLFLRILLITLYLKNYNLTFALYYNRDQQSNNSINEFSNWIFIPRLISDQSSSDTTYDNIDKYLQLETNINPTIEVLTISANTPEKMQSAESIKDDNVELAKVEPDCCSYKSIISKLNFYFQLIEYELFKDTMNSKELFNSKEKLKKALDVNNERSITASRKLKKKFKKFLLPLLIAYKLKFFALIPVLMGGLILLVGTTGAAGFFFALFTAVISLKSHDGH